MNREHTIRRLCKRVGEYGIEDVSIHDVDKLVDLLTQEQKQRWDNALRNRTLKVAGVKA